MTTKRDSQISTQENLEKAWKLVMDLASTPNGAPIYYCNDGYTDGVQCLLCYRFTPGKKMRHADDCTWRRARALRRAEAKKKGRKP